VITLTNVTTQYDGIAAAKALGLWEVKTDGVTSLKLAVYHNKIGTGTISYQLLEVTDPALPGVGVEIGVLSDAGLAGERILRGTFALTPRTGWRFYRLRVKSTVAGDDPVFYSASLGAE